jgi:hypothetical protein
MAKCNPQSGLMKVAVFEIRYLRKTLDREFDGTRKAIPRDGRRDEKNGESKETKRETSKRTVTSAYDSPSIFLFMPLL